MQHPARPDEEAHVIDGSAGPEEQQISGPKRRQRRSPSGPRLVIRIARNRDAVHGEDEAGEAAAVHREPRPSAPQIGLADKAAGSLTGWLCGAFVGIGLCANLGLGWLLWKGN